MDGDIEVATSASSPGRNLINELNNDCLAEVLKYLPLLDRLEMENVCQKWKEASKLSWLYVKKLDLRHVKIRLDERERVLNEMMEKCCKYLTHLIINGEEYPWMIDMLKNNCQNIIHFSIDMNLFDGYEIPKEDLLEIIISMKKLKYLRVVYSFKHSVDIFHQILKILPKDMEEIHLLLFSLPYRAFDEDLPVLNGSNGLHRLTLDGLKLTDDIVQLISENKNTLVKLDLAGCDLLSGVSSSIFQQLKNLEHLFLDKCSNIDANEVVSTAINCSKLKHFYFVNNFLIANMPYVIYSQLTHLNLEYLHISGINFDGVDGNLIPSDAVETNWKQLKYLNITNGLDLSLSDLHEITKLKNLEYLSLEANTQIDPFDLQLFFDIVNNCLELKEFSMNFEHIPLTAFETLANLKKLESLNFRNCKRLTDDLLSKLINSHKNLVNLDLSGCKNLGETCLIQVGKLQHLKILKLDQIKNIPNAMFDDLHKLEDLSCVFCPTVTDEGIIKVLDNCQELSILMIYGTRITVRALVYAAERQIIFKPLCVFVDKSVRDEFRENFSLSTPYLKLRYHAISRQL